VLCLLQCFLVDTGVLCDKAAVLGGDDKRERDFVLCLEVDTCVCGHHQVHGALPVCEAKHTSEG